MILEWRESLSRAVILESRPGACQGGPCPVVPKHLKWLANFSVYMWIFGFGGVAGRRGVTFGRRKPIRDAASGHSAGAVPLSFLGDRRWRPRGKSVAWCTFGSSADRSADRCMWRGPRGRVVFRRPPVDPPGGSPADAVAEGSFAAPEPGPGRGPLVSPPTPIGVDGTCRLRSGDQLVVGGPRPTRPAPVAARRSSRRGQAAQDWE